MEYMVGIEKRLEDHKLVSSRLLADYPAEITAPVKEKMESLTAAWSETNKKVVGKFFKNKLFYN